jgi:O-antigen/teichoic acid export membrane protein
MHAVPPLFEVSRVSSPVTRERRGRGAHLAEPTPNYSGRSRILWTFADQGLSSLTNAGLSIVVARTVSDDNFGAFSLALLTFSFIVGLVRAFVGEPFVVRFSSLQGPIRRRGVGDAGGAAVTLGILAGGLCLIAATVIHGSTGLALSALALSLPGLMLQDTWRHMFFAAGRPAAATVNDLVWTVLQVILLWILLGGHHDSVFLITLAWGASALVAALVGYVQMGVMPYPSATWEWVQETKDISVQLGLGFTVNMGAVNFATYAIGGIVGLAAVGALRAAQVVLGPLNLLFAGFNAFVLPMLARAAGEGERLVRRAVLGSVALGSFAAVWVAVMVLLPNKIGHMILGNSWDGASKVMLPSGLVLVAGAIVLGASNSLVALSRADLMLRTTLVQGPLMLILGLFGAFRWGAPGAAYGFAISQFIGAVVCWYSFLQADADPRRWSAHPRTNAFRH